MVIKELNVKITMDITGNEEHAIDNLITYVKNHFIGHCWSKQYCSEADQDKNYAYRVNELELRES